MLKKKTKNKKKSTVFQVTKIVVRSISDLNHIHEKIVADKGCISFPSIPSINYYQVPLYQKQSVREDIKEWTDIV